MRWLWKQGLESQPGALQDAGVPSATPQVLSALAWSTFLWRWAEFASLQNELGSTLLGGGRLWLCGLGSGTHLWTDPMWLAWWQSHTADLALFTAELFFFPPNKILPETVNMPEASLRGETDGAEELSVLPAYLPLLWVNPEKAFRASSENQHVFSPPTQALPPTSLLLPQHTPPESQGAPRLSKVCGDLGRWEEELRNQKLQLWALHGEAG